ncbi:MAG TPA: hypothetical protein DG048_07315 [Pseudoalteromonas sp.]|nr:hypothetical protein [Pseudoalteromonas sp.]
MLSGWYFLSISKIYIYSLVIILSKFISLALILLIVHSQDDFHYIYILASAPMFIIALVFFKLNKKLNFKFLNIKRLMPSFKRGFSVYIAGMSPNLYNSLPVIFLGLLATDVAFSLFGIASRIVNLVVTAQIVLNKALYPLIIRARNTFYEKFNFIVCLILPLIAFILLYFFGEKVLNFFLDVEAGLVIRYSLILVISTLFTGIINALTYSKILPNKLDKKYRVVVFKASFILSLIAFPVVYFFNVLGMLYFIVFARATIAFSCCAVVYSSKD